MALKDRLKTLKRQTGQTAEPPAPAPGFADRVSRLSGARRTAPAPPTRVSASEVAEAVGGEVIADGLIRIEVRLALSARHGEICLERVCEMHETLPDAPALVPEETVFFDTETTGLSGGTGTTVFLLGMGRVEGNELAVRQYLITAFSGERPMLEEATDWLAGCRSLVSFNGKSFDAPLLGARARLLGMRDPFAGLGHLDLLHATRRAFGRRWPDCRLATAETELLRFVRHDDLPGSEAPEAWFAYLHRGDPGRLPGIARHNHWDIVSLAALLPALADVHRHPVRFGADPLAVARALLKAGDSAAALVLLRGALDALEPAGLLTLAWLHRSRGEWQEACALWERLAEDRCWEAVEHLAKYYEHQARDYRRALEYAMRLPPSPERAHRLRRLSERLAEPSAGLF